MPRSPSRLGRYDSCGEPGGLEAAFYLRCARLRTLERLWRVSPHVYLVSRLSEARTGRRLTSGPGPRSSSMDDAFHCLSRAAPRTLREYGLTRNRCADRRAGLRAVPVGQPRRTVTHYPSAVRYRHTDWRHAAEFRTRVARILTN